MTVTADPTSDHREQFDARSDARFETEAIPYMRQMFPAALRLTHDRCDAEDLIQETFARAYEKFHQFTPGTNLRAWLYCIMSRTFYSACRTRSRRPAEVLAADLYDGADGRDGLTAPSRSAEAEALETIGDSAIMQALAELPSPFKTVIYLSDVQGYQYSDIAGLMGTPIGTVMSRIHRGRQLLRSKLAALVVAPQPGPARSSEPSLASVPAAPSQPDSGARDLDAVPLAA